MSKFYSLFILLLTAFSCLSASAAKTVIMNCDKPENVLLRDGGQDGEIIPFTDNGQDVTIQSDALFVTTSTEDAILSQVTYTSPAGYNAWGSISDGSCLIKVADMSEENTKVYITLATPLSLYINVADPEIITLSEDMSGNAFDLTEGLNEIRVAPYTNLTLAVKDPAEYKLTEVWTSGNPDKKLKINTFTSCSIGSYDYKSGDQIEYVVVPASEFDVPSFELNIDDPSKVSVSVDYKPLSNLGSHNIIDMSGETATVSISAKEYGEAIYKVTLNGVTQTSFNNTSFYITVKPEDVVNVTYNFPDEDFTFNAYTVPDTDRDLVTVKIGGEPYELNSSVSAKAGSKVEVSFDTSRGSVVSILKNGALASTFDVSSFLLMENTTLEIVMNRFEELPIVVNINEPNGVKAEISYQTVELKEGRNDLTFLKKDYASSLTLKAKPGYVINSVSSELNGEIKEYEPSYGEYTVTLEGDMIINIDASPLVKDTKAVIYSSFSKENNIFYGGHCTFQSAYDNEPFNFNEGYNVIEYNNLQSSFILSGYMEDFATPQFYVYVNKELQTSSTSTYYIELNNNSVLKLFLDEEPESYKADFEIEEGAKIEVMANLIENVNPEEGVSDLQGTLIQIRNTDTTDAPILVSVQTSDGNSETVSADEAGIYNVELNSDLTIKIMNKPTGIESIDTPHDSTSVFTVTGIYVGDSTDNLPAGIYIVAGKKIIVH